MRISIVVAAAENGVIGVGNALPWHLPDDLQRFKALTMGKPILMGRKTHESIGRPLPGRTNIVMSRRPGLALPGCIVVSSLQEAKNAAGAAEELVIIGGAELYAQALSFVDVIHLTRVHAHIAGDAYFPPLSASAWRERVIATHPADERHAYGFTFLELERTA
ncbi:MAG TPA: dihydrofolate reductase [Steroidobacteraceae bacterium]